MGQLISLGITPEFVLVWVIVFRGTMSSATCWLPELRPRDCNLKLKKANLRPPRPELQGGVEDGGRRLADIWVPRWNLRGPVAFDLAVASAACGRATLQLQLLMGPGPPWIMRSGSAKWGLALVVEACASGWHCPPSGECQGGPSPPRRPFMSVEMSRGLTEWPLCGLWLFCAFVGCFLVLALFWLVLLSMKMVQLPHLIHFQCERATDPAVLNRSFQESIRPNQMVTRFSTIMVSAFSAHFACHAYSHHIHFHVFWSWWQLRTKLGLTQTQHRETCSTRKRSGHTTTRKRIPRQGIKHRDKTPWCITNNIVPVVPHKAVAEVSKIGNLWGVGCCESRMAERIHWWTDRWLELCFFGMVAMVAVVTLPQLLDVVWCSAVVVAVVAVVVV